MKPKVMIGVLSGDMVHADFCFALQNLTGYSILRCHEQFEIIATCNRKTSVVSKGRNELVEIAREVKGVTHLLMIDSDMTFPPNTLARMLAHNRSVVGVNASTRYEPIRHTVQTIDGNTFLGAGILLVDMAVFDMFGRPWFDYHLGLTKAEDRGEDYYFCHKCHTVGVKPLCDFELSRQVGHIGQKIYGTE